jgi:hypothetical protein
MIQNKLHDEEKDTMVQGYNGNTAFKKELKHLCDKVELSVRKYVYASSPSQSVGDNIPAVVRSDGRTGRLPL